MFQNIGRLFWQNFAKFCWLFCKILFAKVSQILHSHGIIFQVLGWIWIKIAEQVEVIGAFMNIETDFEFWKIKFTKFYCNIKKMLKKIRN